MFDEKTLKAYFNGLVLPHLGYADIVWGHQPGLTSHMKQLRSFQNRFTKTIEKDKVTSVDALVLLQWVPLHGRPFGHRFRIMQDANKGDIPEHFYVFRTELSQVHGYNTRNGYLLKGNNPRTEWGTNTKYFRAINDWALLHSELKIPIPKMILNKI